jgi:hypothetical protein
MKTHAAIALVLLATACSKSESKDKGSGKATESKSESKEKAAPKAGTIEQLKLAYDGPAGEVSDMSMGGDPDWMVMADGLVFTVGTPKEAKTFEQAIEDAELYSPTFTVKEKTADGYHLEFNNTGSMGANYFVEIQRSIGGTTYRCATTQPDAAGAAAAVKACQSLRAI